MIHVDASVADLPELLRRHRVSQTGLAFGDASSVHLRVTGPARVDVDAHNLSAEADGSATLVQLARALDARGFVLPIARPLPSVTLAEACACMPYLVDAFVQQCSAITLDGQPFESPRAPRSATGPSLIHTLASRPPLAIATRVRLRVVAKTHARVAVVDAASPLEAARLLVAAHHEGRAFAVEALGARVVALVGAGTPSHVFREARAVDGGWAHAAGGRFHASRSLVPSDVDAVARVLNAGERVAFAPFMGRAAVLSASFAPVTLVDVERAARGIASALAGGAP